MAWQDLLKIALLGVKKMGLTDETPLPDPISARWQSLEKADQETALLHATALTLFYEQAGYRASRYDGGGYMVAPADELPPAPALYAELMLSLLNTASLPQADLLALVLDKIHAKGWVVPHKTLAPLLEACLTKPEFRGLKERVYTLMGDRGKWLVQINPSWKAMFQQQDEQECWARGNENQRRHLFSAWREKDPERAIYELAKTWPTESARSKKAWLALIAEKPLECDVKFADQIYQDLMEQGDVGSTQSVIIDLKRFCVSILLSQPTSFLFQRVQEDLFPYIKRKSALLTGSGYTIELPVKQDAFFNAAALSLRFGMEPPTTGVGLSDAAYWFNEFVKALHPSAWENLISGKWHEIFSAFARLGRDSHPILETISNSIAQAGYAPAAFAWLKEYPVTTSNCGMLRLLSETELERYFMSQAPSFLEMPSAIRNVLQRKGWVWSEKFSHYALSCLTQGEYAYHNQEFALEVAPHFHTAIIPSLHNMLSFEPQGWTQQQMRRKMVEPLLRTVEMRGRIERL